MNYNKVRYIIHKIGLIATYSLTLGMILAFFVAYMNPDKMVTININVVGESVYEIGFIIFCIPFIIFSVYEINNHFLPKVREGKL